MRHDTDPDRQAAGLTLILNAIVTWNTRYTQAAVDQIRQIPPLDLVTDDVSHGLAPVLHTHTNPHRGPAAVPVLGRLRP